MLRLFMNRPFKIKIIVLSLLSSVILVTLLAVFFYVAYYNNVVEEAKVYQTQNMTFVKQDIENVQDNIINLSTSLLYSPSFQMQISPKQDQLSSGETTDVMNSISFLTNSIVSNNYVSLMSINATNGYHFYYARNGLTTPAPFKLVQKSTIYQTAIQMRGEAEWIAVPRDGGNLLLNNTEPKLTMLRGLIDIDNRQSQGVMVVCIDWNSIWSSMTKQKSYGNFIVDSNGNIVTASTDLASMDSFVEGRKFQVKQLGGSSGNSIITIDGQKYLFCSSLLYQSGLYVVCLRPMSAILKDLSHFNIVLTILIGVSMLLSLAVATLLSTIVTTPLKNLVTAIQQAGKGDLKQKVDFVYQDEIGILGGAFNQMVGELNVLFNKVMKLEIKSRDAELKSLQAQINPHFLYNTLDSIYLKAMRANDQDIGEMVYALSRIFRLTLNLGSTMTTVNNETEFIENYILLQKIRLKDRLEFKLSIDDQLLPMEMPKLILQPFVENAIVHAAEKQTHQTQILVRGFYAGGYIFFTISDNGAGMEKEVLREINSETGNGTGYAIRNIRERLELCYGSDCSLEIFSEPGNGTTVFIRIPE